MVPPMLTKKFKFNYFFCAQIPIKNIIPLKLVSCDVVESNNISCEQISLPHAPELHSSSPKIFDVDPNAMLEIIDTCVDHECVPPSKKLEKVVADVNCKFQEIPVVKMPWAKPIYNEVGLISAVKYCVCTIIERKEKNWLLNGNLLINMQVKIRVLMVKMDHGSKMYAC
jgi:hypothetical protein